MKFCLYIFLFISMISCSYNTTSPTDTLENYSDTLNRELILVKSDANYNVMETAMIRNRNIFGKYIIAITGDVNDPTLTINNIKKVLNDSKYANDQIEVDFSKTTLTSMPKNAFKDIKTLGSVLLCDVMFTIEDSAFENCISLSYIRFPKDLREIKDNAFKNCKAIKSLYLFGSVTTIGKNSFDGLSEMESLVLPENLTKIDDGAFANCTKLKKVQYFGTDPKELQNSKQAFNSGTSPEELYLPDVKEALTSKCDWKNFLCITWKSIYYSQYIK